MIKDKDDIELKKILEDNSEKAGENEWFTPRLMNRLPERQHQVRWMQPAAYLLCAMICAAMSVYLILTQDLSVVLVKDVVMLGITFVCTILMLTKFTRSVLQL